MRVFEYLFKVKDTIKYQGDCVGLLRFLLRLFKRKREESEEFSSVTESEFSLPTGEFSLSVDETKSDVKKDLEKEKFEPQLQKTQDALLALISANKRYEALTSANYRLEEQKMDEKFEINKPSLELGVAAGYVGRAIKDIEFSLQRIESQMATKDWIILNVLEPLKMLLNQKFKELKEELKDLLQEKRVKVDEKEKEFLLSEKMRKILNILRERGENGISYAELSKLLGISISSLRGLLSIMCKHVKNIERFSVDKQGWVRLKQKFSAN